MSSSGPSRHRSVALAGILLVSQAAAALAPEHARSIVIETLDAEGAPVRAGQLEWWVAGDAEHKRVVGCRESEGVCGTWLLAPIDTLPTRLVILVPRAREHDPACVDFFVGTVSVEGGGSPAVLSVSLARGRSACR